MSQTEEIRSKLAELGERFLKRTSGELAKLRDFTEKARGGDAAAIGELRHLAHRMHGTGATLGFTDIGDQAAQIERMADAQPVDFEAIDVQVAKIDELIKAAAANSGVSL